MEVEMNVARVHHHHHQQEISSQTLESMLVCTKPQEDKKPKPPEETLKCPRCDSINTKFCYYNNYSLTQPRYFCKSCRRYWTKGGTLRNVPVGGSCRKNKRSSSSSPSPSPSTSSLCATSSSSSLSKIRDHNLNLIIPNSNNQLLAGVPHLPYDSTPCSDLSLAFARLQSQANGSMGYDHFDHPDHHLGTDVDPLGFLGFLENTTTITNNRFHDHNVLYNLDQQQVLNNPMRFHGDQDQEMTTCSAATTPAVKQEACNNMVRSSHEVGLWGAPWQMGADQGTMVHEVESAGRSMIGGWINNGIGSTKWNGLINSPLM